MGRRVEQVTASEYRAEERTPNGLLVVKIKVIPSPSSLEVDPSTGEIQSISPENALQQQQKAQSPERDVRSVLEHVEAEPGATTMVHIMGDHGSHNQLLGGAAEQGENPTKIGTLAQHGIVLPAAPHIRVRARVHGHFDPDEITQFVMPNQPIEPGSQQARALHDWTNSYVAGATTETLAEVAQRVGGYQQNSARTNVRVK